MSNGRTRSWISLTLALGLVIAAGGAIANEVGFSQYLAGKNHDSRPLKIWNPTGYEMFVLYVSYDGETGEFDECDSLILPAKTRNDDDVTSDSLTDAYWELLAVPSMGSIAGQLHAKFGVNAKDRGGRTPALMQAKNYRLPKGTPGADVVECACQELDDAALDSKLLKEFGINCPN